MDENIKRFVAVELAKKKVIRDILKAPMEIAMMTLSLCTERQKQDIVPQLFDEYHFICAGDR